MFILSSYSSSRFYATSYCGYCQVLRVERGREVDSGLFTTFTQNRQGGKLAQEISLSTDQSIRTLIFYDHLAGCPCVPRMKMSEGES